CTTQQVSPNHSGMAYRFDRDGRLRGMRCAPQVKAAPGTSNVDRSSFCLDPRVLSWQIHIALSSLKERALDLIVILCIVPRSRLCDQGTAAVKHSRRACRTSG